MKHLTAKEEELMGFFWSLGALFVKQIVEMYDAPKPHYNTLSTIVRGLEEKGFLSYNAYGNTHQYYAIITEKEYRKGVLERVVEKYYDNSYTEMVSVLIDEGLLTAQELADLIGTTIINDPETDTPALATLPPINEEVYVEANTHLSQMVQEQDLSSLWTTSDFLSYEDGEPVRVGRSPALGYFGRSYNRFQIHYLSIRKAPSDRKTYHVVGMTKKKYKVYFFQGEMKIKKVMMSTDLFQESYQRGYVEGTYMFREDKSEFGSGILEGKFRSYFFIDSDGAIRYDGLQQIEKPSFSNNTFEGVWTSYTNNKERICNWGDFRIPEAQGFDVGEDSFRPAVATSENGWLNYERALPENPNETERKAAQRKENEAWWNGSR